MTKLNFHKNKHAQVTNTAGIIANSALEFKYRGEVEFDSLVIYKYLPQMFQS